jgi:pilus assembly protein CpaE
MSSKVLIVEDDLDLLRAIGLALKKEGYEIATAESGEEALRKVQTEKPDLVILDIMLPGTSGIEVCQQLRDKAETVGLPIIMLSALARVDDRIKGLKVGADDYVTKPFDLDELVARVAALLERTRRLRAGPAVQRGRVLGFLGAKGGVGTTTVAVNVALALAQRRNRVIAVELRPYFGTMALQLGSKPHPSAAGWLELPAGDINERQLTRYLSGDSTDLRALLGPQKVDDYRQVEAEQVEAVLTALSTMADYVVADLPCQPSEAVRAALGCCARAIVVVEPEPACVRAAGLTIELLQTWGMDPGQVRAVVVHRARMATPMSVATIGTTLGREILGGVAHAADLPMKAIELGQPLVVSAPDSMAALALGEIAERLAAQLS